MRHAGTEDSVKGSAEKWHAGRWHAAEWEARVMMKNVKMLLPAAVFMLTGFLPAAGVKAETADDLNINLTHIYENGMESAEISAYWSDGPFAWEYLTGEYEAAQLDRITEIGVNGDQYYLIEDGSVVALDLETGEVNWINEDFRGSPAQNAFDFTEDGTLLISGYLGPDLFAVAADGETLAQCVEFNSDYYWPYSVRYTSDNQIVIIYEMYPDGEGNVQTIDLDQFLMKYAVYSEKTGNKDRLIFGDEEYLSDINASSCLSEYGMTHWARLMLDGDLSTAWVEGASGNGIGEQFTMDLNDEYSLIGFIISSGYQKSEELYYKNARPAAVRVYFSDGTSEYFEILDIMDQQVFHFGEHDGTDFVTFRIEDVYPGTTYSDTCISEIELF